MSRQAAQLLLFPVLLSLVGFETSARAGNNLKMQAPNPLAAPDNGPPQRAVRPVPPATATISIHASPDADVVVQGESLPAVDATRKYTTANLDPTRNYKIEVRATWSVNGREVSLTQTVNVMAGDHKGVTFIKPEPRDPWAVRPR